MRPTTRLPLLACAALALLAPAGVSAQYLAPRDVGSVEQFKMLQLGPYNPLVGTQVGPYTTRMVSYPGQPLVSVFCVDFLHDVTIGQTWTANVSTLNLADMSDTRIGIGGDSGDALSRYMKAAWLASHFVSGQNDAVMGEIHAAIWTVALDGSDPTKPYYGKYGNWLNLANQAEADGYGGFNFKEWAVITDVHAADLGTPYDPLEQPGVQEFLIHVTVTPEPETWIMLISGLLVLAYAWRRREQLLA